MHSALRILLLAAAGALCLAPAAFAQSYGRAYGDDRYAPPPPPPPPTGAVFPRDDRYYDGPTTPNADGSIGYRPYVSQLDTTPDDPGRLAYDVERDRRVLESRNDGDYDDAPPPYPRRAYGSDGYGQPAYAPTYPRQYGDGYARPYSDPRRSPAYADRYDGDEDDDAPPPPPRYARPQYDGGYAPAPSPRGW